MKRFAVLVILSSCTTTPPAPTIEPIPYALDAGGVQLLDRPQRIDFGRTDHSAIKAMTKLVGVEPINQQACIDGQKITWADGTALIFVRGDFRGWQSPEGSSGGIAC